MSHASTYQPKTAFTRWLDSRLPIVRFVADFMAFGTPRTLNYLWTFGAILTFFLVIQIFTGVILAMHYTPNTALAFDSIEKMMRDVNYGWLMRYTHAVGGSLFFLAVYIHTFRGLYYGSYKAPREVLWMIGVAILIVMIATAFMGLYGAFVVKTSNLAPLFFVFVFRGAGWRACGPPPPASRGTIAAQDFVTIKGGTRQRARRLAAIQPCIR